jgi:hypothetical protein
MPRKYLIPADRTLIFIGFRSDLSVVAIEQYIRRCLGPSLSAVLDDRNPISIAGGKAYINFNDSSAAQKARETLIKTKHNEICPAGAALEIWLKKDGRSNSSLSPCDPTGATASKSKSVSSVNLNDQG